MTSSLIDKFSSFQKELEEIKNKFTEKNKEILLSLFQEFFTKYSKEVEYISWAQYTPYFNDGEDGVFCIYEVWAVYRDLLPDSEYEEERSLYSVDFYDNCPENFKAKVSKEKAIEIEGVFSELTKTLNSIPLEILKCTFGDHVRVNANSKGFTTDHYDHD